MSIFESSESVSSIRPGGRQVVNAPNHDYRIIIVKQPVPCTICSTGFRTRDEQVSHYHSEQHIERLRKKCHQKCGDIWKKAEKDENHQCDVQVININLDASQNEISQISHFSILEYRCETCDQVFKSQGALENHLGTKKHQNNIAKQCAAEPTEHREVSE